MDDTCQNKVPADLYHVTVIIVDSSLQHIVIMFFFNLVADQVLVF